MSLTETLMSRKETLVSEIESGVKRIYIFNELIKFTSTAKRCTEAAIDEAAIKLWSRAIKPIENLFFYVTHEKVSIVGTHSDTHAAPLVCV